MVSPLRRVSHLLARSSDRYVHCNAEVHLCVDEERMEGKDVLLLSSSFFFFFFQGKPALLHLMPVHRRALSGLDKNCIILGDCLSHL